MDIVKPAAAGTLESSDIRVTVEPAEEDVTIELESSVKEQFGRQIESVIRQTLEELGVRSATVIAVDKGALDCTVRARVEAAVFRACEEPTSWEVFP